MRCAWHEVCSREKPTRSIPMKSGFESISDMALANVSGGTTPTTSTGTSSSNDQLMTAVQGIQSSLKSIGSSNQNQGLFGGSNGLMFMTMALAMQRRQS